MPVRKKKMLALIAAGCLLLGAVRAQAFDSRYDSKEDINVQYEAGSAAKLTRGITNTLFGWSEIARTPAAWSAGIEHGPVTAFLIGLPYGVFRAVGRTAVGVYESATFFAPQSPIMKDLKGDIS